MAITSEYIKALEDERRKISVFQSELPLSLELVTQAIEECKHKLLLGKAQSEEEEADLESTKSDWLRSAQLWNQTPDPPPPQQMGNGGAFHPFKRGEKAIGITKAVVQGNDENGLLEGPAGDAASCSKEETGGGCRGGGKCNKEEKQGQLKRKVRRSWSPELHKRFTEALHQLGGSNVATPKQIREFMKVDGLSNDEVKSHLQKYRLHHKRLSPPVHDKHLQHPQFVVVGGIWIPPPEYAAMDTTTIFGEETKGVAPNEIYAPVAKLATAPVEDASTCTKHRQHQHPLPPHDGNSSSGAGVDSQASSLSVDNATT